MTTGTKVFIVFIVLLVLVGFYLISQVGKTKTVTPSQTPTEPTANIWTVLGGLLDVFDAEGDESGMDKDISGQYVNADGYLVDEDGNYVNTQGVLLTMVEVPIKFTQLV